MNADEKLREILRAEADVVEPSAVGWDRIREGIAVRRRRRLWLRSSLAAATAMSLVAVIALVTAQGDDPDVRSDIFATQAPSPEPEPSASPGPPVSATADDPLPVVWPLTTQREISYWQANPASRPALRSPETAAKEFVLRYLALEDVRVESSGVAAGTSFWVVSRLIVPGDEKTRVFIATVAVTAGYVGDDPEPGPFLVSRVESGDGGQPLTVTSPTGGATVTSPVTVTGSVDGVDESVRVEIRAHNPAGAAGYVELAKAFAPAGAEQPWEARLSFAGPLDDAGAVYASTSSPADGKLSAVTVVPVVLTMPQQQDGAARAGAPPAVFVAVTEGRLAAFDTATGRRLRYLTEAQPGGGASDPSATDDALSVVFVQGDGTCATTIRQVPTSGDTPPETLVSSDGGRVLGMPAYNRHGDLAYLSTDCDATSPQQVVVHEASGARRRIELGLAETSVRSIAWRPDGEVLAVITTSCCDQTTELRLVRRSDKEVAQGVLVRSDQSCLLADVAWTAESTLITASTCPGADDGDSTSSVVQQQGETNRVFVTTPSYLIDSLAVDPSGDHFLLGGLECSETCEGAPTVRRFSVGVEPVKAADGLTQPVWVG